MQLIKFQQRIRTANSGIPALQEISIHPDKVTYIMPVNPMVTRIILVHNEALQVEGDLLTVEAKINQALGSDNE